MEQLLKHTMLWRLGLPENVKENFGIGACRAKAGAVILQSAEFINCFQLFFDRRGGSQVDVLPPCAAPSGKEMAWVGEQGLPAAKVLLLFAFLGFPEQSLVG